MNSFPFSLSLWQMEMIPWYAILAYFVINWQRVKQARTDEGPESRFVHGALGVVGALLLFSTRFRIGVLGWRFVPQSVWLQGYAILVTSLGGIFAIWARYTLGREWSGNITTKVNHELIRSGLYAFIRHPIYTGILLAAAGTVLFVGEWRGILAFLFFVATFVHKANKEEILMTREFGDRYEKYRQETGFLIPRFH